MKKLVLLFLFIFYANLLYSQSINLRLSTYFYTWNRFDSLVTSGTSPSTLHVRGYQNLLLYISKNRWGLNTLIQTEEDVIKKIGDGFNYRFYNLYIKGSNLLDILDIKLGRQYVFAGVGKGNFDGLYLKIKIGRNKEYQLTGFGGALTPNNYEFKSYNNLKDNYITGGQFSYYGLKNFMASVSYSNRKRKPQSYKTYRADSSFNTTTRIIEVDSPGEQMAGLDLNYTHGLKHNFFGKAYYYINRNKLYRGEFNARISLIDNLRLSASYLYSEPQLSYNTIFWVFSYKPNHEIEGGIDYTFKNGLILYGKVSDVIYEKDNSLKLQLGFNYTNYGLSLVRYMGYTGESDGASGYYVREIIKDKISFTSSVSYSRYKLSTYATEKINSLNCLLGFTLRPNPQFSIDAQGQFLINRIYKFDSRLLIGFNYWLFKKF